MVTQVFTHFLLLIFVVVDVVVVVEVGLIGTPGLFRLPEPSAPEPEKGFQLAKSLNTQCYMMCWTQIIIQCQSC